MTNILDLDALERETSGEPFGFRFAGHEYLLAPRLDIRAAAALEAGRLDEGLRLLLGPEQWEALCAAPGVFDDELLQKVLEGYAAHLGISLGNSAASSASSAPTRVRSRQTSNGSTERTSVAS